MRVLLAKTSVALAVLAWPCLTAAQDAKGGPFTNSLGMKLALIPAGEFLMGRGEPESDLARDFPGYEKSRIAELDDETPTHRVRITRPFYLGVHEVTVGQFRAFVERSGYRTDAERDGEGGWGFVPKTKQFSPGRSPEYSWRNLGFPQGDDHPVLNVSWYDAVAFCDWLTKQEGRTYRLPTEAEWEYACRARTTTRFSQSDDPEGLARVGNVYDATTGEAFPEWLHYALKSSDGRAFTAPVGSYAPNRFGLYDMHGNAWEWCSDWYGEDYYGKAPVDDPKGPETGHLRVRRGGAWQTWALYARSSYRNFNTRSSRYWNLGFRVAADAPR